MKKLTAFALLGAICVLPSVGNAAVCGPVCPTSCAPCKPVCAPVCVQPVCRTTTTSCVCCPVIRGFLDGGNRGAWANDGRCCN